MAREIIMRIAPAKWAGQRFLVPVDAKGEQTLADIKSDQILGCTIRQKRNLAHHNKYWALMAACWDHQALYPTTEALSDGIKMACGHTEETLNPVTMEISLKPASIAFDKMDQDAFEEFYERAVGIIIERILPGVNSQDLDNQIDDIMKGRS